MTKATPINHLDTHFVISRPGYAHTSGAPVGFCLLWLKDEALEERADLVADPPDRDAPRQLPACRKREMSREARLVPAPVIAQEIVQDLEAALEQFREIEADLKG